MATLEELRTQLDEIDNRNGRALSDDEWMSASRVGEYKVKAGRKVYDQSERKRQTGRCGCQKSRGNFNKKGIKELYSATDVDEPEASVPVRLVEVGSARDALPFIQNRNSGSRKCPSCISGNRGGLRAGCNASVLRKMM